VPESAPEAPVCDPLDPRENGSLTGPFPGINAEASKIQPASASDARFVGLLGVDLTKV